MLSKALLFLAATGFGAAPGSGAATSSGASVLQDDRYRFCHDADYPLSGKDARWCPIIGEQNDVCPTLPAACAKPPQAVDVDITLGGGSGSSSGSNGDGDVANADEDDGDGDAEGRASRGEVTFHPRPGNGSGSGSGTGSGSGSGNGRGDGSGDASGNGSASGTPPIAHIPPGRSRPPNSPPGSAPPTSSGNKTPPRKSDAAPPPPPPPPPPSGLSVFAQILLFILIGGGAVLLARAIAKHLSWRKKQSEVPEEIEAPKTEAQTVVPEKRGPVETDVERLLRRAQAAAKRGDFGQAVEDAYAALLRRLDGAGLIEIHPSRTNGDYVRALGEKPELKSNVRSIVRDVERVQFGSEAPSAQLFQTVFDKVVPIATRAIGVLALLFATSTLVSCGKAPKPESERGDTRPYGTAALAETLEARGLDVTHRKDRLGDVDEEATDKVLVLLRGAELDRDTWSRVIDWTNEGGTLVVAGLRHLPLELGAEPKDDPSEETLLFREGSYNHGYRFSQLSVVAPAGTKLRTAVPKSGWVLARGEEPYAVQSRYGKGRIFVFAERALFTNIAFTTADNAEFITAFLDDLDREDIEICDMWTGAGAGSPLESIRKAKLTAVVAQLLALALLFLVWKGAHFGKPRDPASKSRRAFADHVRALGNIYARAKASEHALGNFSAWAIERLRERYYRGQRSGLSPLAEQIAARTGRDETKVMRVLVEAQSARESSGPPSSFRPGYSPGAPPPKRGSGEERDLGLIRALFDFLRTHTDRKKGSRARTS